MQLAIRVLKSQKGGNTDTLSVHSRNTNDVTLKALLGDSITPRHALNLVNSSTETRTKLKNNAKLEGTVNSVH